MRIPRNIRLQCECTHQIDNAQYLFDMIIAGRAATVKMLWAHASCPVRVAIMRALYSCECDGKCSSVVLAGLLEEFGRCITVYAVICSCDEQELILIARHPQTGQVIRISSNFPEVYSERVITAEKFIAESVCSRCYRK